MPAFWSRGVRILNLRWTEIATSQHSDRIGLFSLRSVQARFLSPTPTWSPSQSCAIRRFRTDHRHSSGSKPATKRSWRLIPRSQMEENAATACQHIRSDMVSKGKWIGLSEITYKDPTGKERKWEAVFRTTKIGDDTDAVVIIPILKRKHKPDFVVLVNQYRPPMKGYSLEFPAGLIDKGEHPQVCAVRELKEETGYTGVPTHISPGVSLDPGLANSTVNMVTVEIDGDDECNKRPEQQQDEGEFIEVLSVPVDNLLETLNNFTKQGVVVHSIVYTYAMARSHVAKTDLP